jgi:DNA polymerase III subunit delta
MIVKFFELNKKDLKKNKYFLLYGDNKGLIEETLDKTIRPLFTNHIYRYDESDIIKNPENFDENISNKSFFEDEKLIIISRTSDKIFKIIGDVVNKNIENVSIILLAGILEKKSKLRNFFEKDKKSVCVAFYEDNLQSLNILAQNFLREKKISLSQQNINLIIERCSGDRINLYNELQKIENFSRNKKNINTEDILKLTNLSENFDITELVDNTLAKNQKKTLNILNENNFATEDSILILRSFINKLKRLLKLQTQLSLKGNIDEIVSNFKPPIFWKEKDTIKKQIKILSYEKILKLIIKINYIELLVKKYPGTSINIVTNFILEQTLET